MALFRSEKEFLEAASSGDPITVSKYLAHSKKWLRAHGKDGAKAIHLAARAGNTGVYTMLEKAGAYAQDRNTENGATPLVEAISAGHISLVRHVLEKETSRGVSTSGQGISALQAAILNDRVEIVELLLEKKLADLTAGNPPAVYYAVMNNKPAMVDVLISAGADPSVPRKQEVPEYDREYFGYSYSSRSKTVLSSPLQAAANINSTELISSLLAAGARKLPDERPLHAVAAAGNIEAAALLLEHGTQRIGDRNDANQSPLHLAAQKNQLEMAKFLLAQGADKNLVDKEKRTALSYAQQFAMKEMIELLQGPLPPRKIVEIRKQDTVPAPVPTFAKPAAMALPSAADTKKTLAVETAAAPSELWTLAGNHSVAHITVMPILNKKLTELFNFQSRERVTFSENLATKLEIMAPHQSFDEIGDEALTHAFQEFTRLGGKADEVKVFKHNLNKTQLKKPAGI
ncbi:MAG TPA: ankyrin repeat domain-containing protein [Patescibacteria group bacterium]|nr:ankyrin repeat domain-containing protein [Patescibacteria group bacterium]